MTSKTTRKPAMTVGNLAATDEGGDAALRAFAASQNPPTGLPAEKIDAEAENSPATATAAPAATQAAPEPEQPVKGVVIESLADLRQFVEEKPSVQPMSIRVPKSLYNDLKFLEKFGGKTMTDVIVEATTPVVAELLAKKGLR